MRIAVMQPYLFPYSGYFRLITASDTFVIFDDVQFPRRGWLHRNRLPDAQGELQWLTLPLAKAPFDAKICALRFAEDAPRRLSEQLPRFPALATSPPSAAPLLAALHDLSGSPVDHLERTLKACCDLMGLPFNAVRSSSLDLDPALRAQDRILAIAGALGATAYVNAPGGLDLYDPAAFADAGFELNVLTPWRGPMHSVLQRLLTEDPTDVGAEIRGQSIVMRRARPEECPALTRIALAAKAHWGYPDAWLQSWLPELTVSSHAARQGLVFVAQRGDVPLATASLSLNGAEAEIEGMWVQPQHMGLGLGAALMAQLSAEARRRGATRLRIVSDPNAEGFYAHHGAQRVGWQPSTPAGRQLPLMSLPLTPAEPSEP